MTRPFIHESAYVDKGAVIGSGTRIWHFSHVMPGAVIGSGCVLGQNVFVADGVVIGNGVKIQNNVSLYTGVRLEDHVFVGPSAVFTNVINPRSHIERKDEYRQTLVRHHASIGANATIVCGATIGAYAFVAAGAVVTKDVTDFSLVMGVPAKHKGWVCKEGHRLQEITIRPGFVEYRCPITNALYMQLWAPTRLIPAAEPGAVADAGAVAEAGNQEPESEPEPGPGAAAGGDPVAGSGS